MSDTQAFGPPVAGTGPAQVAAGLSGAAAAASRDPGTDAPLLEVTDLVTHYPVRRSMTDAAVRRPRRRASTRPRWS